MKFYDYFAAENTNTADGNTPDNAADQPVTPLPNPGEGGPVLPEMNSMPTIPLPNPGEGGPVLPEMNSMPTIPLPNPGEGGPAAPGTNSMPTIPLPNPGEGGPAAPGGTVITPPGGNSMPDFPVAPLPNFGEGGPVTLGFPNSVITVLPRPIIPCFFCNSNSFGNVRFLNAATGYNPFRVSVNNQPVVTTLDYAEISEYGRVSSGSQTITVSGQNGYVYLRRQIPITANTRSTIAIVNTAGSLDLTVISDRPCNAPSGMSCIRACNLSHNSGPLNVLLSNGIVVFRNVQFQEATPFSRIMPGQYQFFVSRSMRLLVSSGITVRSNCVYTIYMFNWNNSPDAIRTMVVEDRN